MKRRPDFRLDLKSIKFKLWAYFISFAALLMIVVAPTLSQQAHAATLHALPHAAAMADTGAVMQVVRDVMRNDLWGSWAGGQGACVDSCKALPVPITRPLEADAVRARNAKREVSRRTVKVHARHFGSRAG